MMNFIEQGIKTFDDLYTFPVNADKLTDNPGRTVETINFVSRNTRCTLYIKKHEDSTLNVIKDRARIEWKSHLICERLGIPVPTLVAWGFSANPVRSCSGDSRDRELLVAGKTDSDGMLAKPVCTA